MDGQAEEWKEGMAGVVDGCMGGSVDNGRKDTSTLPTLMGLFKKMDGIYLVKE